MGKKSKKPGQVGGRQWAPSSSTNAIPNTARPAWGGNGSSHPSGTSWAQGSDRCASHFSGKSHLKYDEMRSYNEMLVNQMKQMSEDKQQLNYLKNKVIKAQHCSKAVEETLGVISQKQCEIMEENIFVRSKAKEKHLEYEQKMKYQEELFHSQIEDIHNTTEDKEKLFEKLKQEECSKAGTVTASSCGVVGLVTPSSRDRTDPMLCKPSSHRQPPVSLPGSVEVDPQLLPPAGLSKPHEMIFPTKVVDFFGHRTPIIYQNHNGPCSFLAICNVLLLKNVIRLNLDASEVSQKELISLVSERLLNLKSSLQDKDEEYVENWEQKIKEAIGLLSHLMAGLDVNVMFTKIDDFEFTRECAIFDLLDIPLYHGWIVDPQDTETSSAIGSMSCNILASKVADFMSRIPTEKNTHVEEELQGNTSKEPGDHQPAASTLSEADKETCNEHFDVQIHDRCLLDKATEHQCELLRNFLYGNKLTVYGLSCLHKGVNERELCAFFYNNHLNTMFKYKGSLYVLATAESLISKTDLVWQKLDEVKGFGAFFTSNFEPFKDDPVTNDLWNEQQAMTSTDDCHSQFDNSMSRSMGGPNVDLDKDLYTLPPFGRKENKRLTLPRNLYEILKPHQKQGIEWLWSLHCSGMPGGIVADDMGLGKTLQTTTFLSGLFHSNLIESVLIIAPLSILDAWVFELKRCGLKRRIQIYNTTEDKGFQIVKEQGGILLISYALYLRNCKKFASPNKEWSYVLLDEAHKIKNMEADITKSMEEIKCNKKILLSGTPLTRDLMDMFSLMRFINKDVFGEKALFKKNYISRIEVGKFSNSCKRDKEEYQKALSKCWRKLSPYVLRRSKSVLIESGDLPCKKHDIIVWLCLTQCQVDLYTKFCELYVPLSDPFHPEKKQSFIKTLICQYICNDPGALLHIRDNESCGSVIREMVANLLQATNLDDLVCRHHSSSSKVSFVLDLIKELFDQESLEKEVFERRKKGEQWKKVKVLIFSQHIFMLNRIKECLKAIIKEDDMVLIDGTTPKEERYESIKNFNSDNGPRVFLLTARVGGEGLTLTAATKAIIVDPSWNLSDDNQIADRIYRIGQNHDVTIYRLLTCGTVDEHAYKLQLLKGNLSQAVLDGKLPASLVKKEESKVLKVPIKGFNWSETQNLIKRVIRDRITLGGKAECFLRTHPFVVGLTSQNHVFSKVEISLSDIEYDKSDDENGTAMEKPFMNIDKTKSGKSTPWDVSLRSRQPTNTNLGKPQVTVPDTAIWREIEIPANKVGMLIGRDGDTIKKIRLQSSAVISPEDRRANPNSPFKSVRILGTLKEFEKAKTLILDAIEKEQVEYYISVTKDKVGQIIGTGGRKVKELEEITGAHINYISGANKFRISGASHKVVEDAKSRILEAINRNRQRHPDDGRARPGPPRARRPPGK